MTASARRQPIVAIDGPVGAGKTTVARAVAQRLGFRHVDTGAMYRSVAWAADHHGIARDDEQAITKLARALRIDFAMDPSGQRILVDGVDVTEAIRTAAVSDGASVVSVYPGVREAMVAIQRRLGAKGGVVMEGRDIGTVVFPDADVKVFLDASLDERVRRRFAQLQASGAAVDFASVRKAEEERDRRDRTRSHSPLRPADDAVVLDSTGVAVDEAVERVVKLVRQRGARNLRGDAHSAPITGHHLPSFFSGLWYFVWGKVLVGGTLRLAFRTQVEGSHNEPPTGPFIAAVNHASALDPLLVGGALRRQLRYMAKSELFRIPILGAWLASMGVFPVRRGQPDRKAIRTSLEALGDGWGLVMFPEGTRSPDGTLQEAEPGAALLALRTGAPVLPVAVINSHRILPKGAHWPRFERVTVRIGQPIQVPRMEGRLAQALLAEWGERIMGDIEKLLPPDQKRKSSKRSLARSPQGPGRQSER